MKVSIAAVSLAVVFIFLAIGCAYVYCNGEGDYQSTAEMNADGTVAYTLSGNTSQYRYSVFSNTSIPNKVYLYLDENYQSEFNTHYIQSEYLNVMKQMLERRGCSAVEFANAEELVGVMNENDSAVLFISGALPDTIYNGSDVLLFKTWLENGGTVYWSGPEMGRYVSTKEGVTDLGTGFFEGKVNTKWGFTYNESEMFEYTGTHYYSCQYGLKTDLPNSLCLAFVSDDGYSTVSVAKLFNGNVTVFGGNIATTENVSQALIGRTTCADLIVCGLTYQSEGLDCGNGDIRGNLSSNTTVDVSSYSEKIFFISVGQNASEWSRAIKL